MKVLIVEDDLAALMMCAAQLELHDYDLLTATDGAQGVLAASDYRDDLALIICDLMLPIVPGIEVIKRVRRFYSGPILVMTAYGNQKREAAIKAGATEFMVKDDPLAIIRRAREILNATKAS